MTKAELLERLKRTLVSSRPSPVPQSSSLAPQRRRRYKGDIHMAMSHPPIVRFQYRDHKPCELCGELVEETEHFWKYRSDVTGEVERTAKTCRANIDQGLGRTDWGRFRAAMRANHPRSTPCLVQIVQIGSKSAAAKKTEAASRAGRQS
jgi:hypothetical protein